MAHSDQARKRNRQNIKNRLRNRQVKSDIKTVIKSYRDAAAKGDTAKLMSEVESKLDKAAKRRIIPAGRANRLKARLRILATRKPAAQPAAK
ncbi:MAG: 30S ribosomal protein S20 [Planctomycetes bacterium]|nr:30S ribosomal protein S20 [Planctomycetota bacterium]